jgi:uroporphyrinogen-III synthase
VTPVVAIRPQPGCDATVAAARARGMDARGFPLFAVKPLAWSPPDPDTVDALLIGSANALRHGGAALARYRGKPAYAVGAASAEAARAAGFDVVAIGEDRLQTMLAALAPEHRRLLRLAGKARVALAAPGGVTITERVLYASEPRPMPSALARRLRAPAVVLLHSGEAARHFAAQCDDNGIARAPLALAAIAPRVAQTAGGGWRAVAAAARPDDAALLALAGELCQTHAGSQTLQDGS